MNDSEHTKQSVPSPGYVDPIYDFIDPFDDNLEELLCGIENPDECEACG